MRQSALVLEGDCKLTVTEAGQPTPLLLNAIHELDDNVDKVQLYQSPRIKSAKDLSFEVTDNKTSES